MRLGEVFKYRWDEVAGYGLVGVTIMGLGVAFFSGIEKYEEMDVINQEGLRHAFTEANTTGTSNIGCYADGNGSHTVHNVETGEEVEGMVLQGADGHSCYITQGPIPPTGAIVYNVPVIQ